jgi:hypothetical protein
MSQNQFKEESEYYTLTKFEIYVIVLSLIQTLATNAFSYQEEGAAKKLIKKLESGVVVKRGIPTTYGHDLKTAHCAKGGK